ncbi:MAG TPA: hypothetical protein VK973_15510 [Arenicellales bacterium]|nr:hypothetical protein [Arenicellales bacterium]
MSEHWHDFLESEGLSTGPDGHTHTESENVDAFQKLSGDTLCDLNYMTMVEVQGEDAGEFLQNQLTNDIEGMDNSRSQLSGYCNPKGRLVCIFRVWRSDDGFVLQLPADLQEAAIDRLRKYVLRSRVRFATNPDNAAFGLCGKAIAKGLETIMGELPGRDGEIVRGESLTVIRLPGDGRPRYQVAGPEDACMAAWKKLARHAEVVGSWSWARMDILAGIPDITAQTCEAFVPQMVNLDLLEGVSFRKGCYPGQEIVARMHYLGNLKQRMGRFRVDTDSPPAPGDRLHAQGAGSPVGTIVSAQPGAGSGWDLLAVVRIEHLDGQTLYLNGDNGARLFRQALPYDNEGVGS